MPYNPTLHMPNNQTNQPTCCVSSTTQLTLKNVSQNARCIQHTGILRTNDTHVSTCYKGLYSSSNHGNWPTPVQKNCQSSIHEGPPWVPVQCALPKICNAGSLSVIDMHAGILKENMSPWFHENPLTNHLHKAAPTRRHTDSKSQLQIRNKAH